MKKVIFSFVMIFALICVSGIAVVKIIGFSAEPLVRCYGNLVEYVGRKQLTKEKDLIGEKVNDDDYTGEYTAECNGQSGNDIIFGGASLYGEKIHLGGKISIKSGNAVLRVRQGTKVKEYAPNRDGEFDVNLSFEGGENYVLVLFRKFSGTIKITSERIED